MPWVKDKYYYTKGILEAITIAYDSIYEDGLLIANHDIKNLYAIAEYKADFDMALDAIGRGRWEGLMSRQFEDYRRFGRLQRIVIADILGITDYELQAWGFYDIPRLRGTAYRRMLEWLNSFEWKTPQS